MAKTKLKALYELMQTEYDDSEIESMLVKGGYISLDKEYQFVDNVVANCFDNVYNYQPEYFTLAMFINALHFYYGIKHNNEKCLVDMLYGSDFYGKSIREVLLRRISPTQLENIRKSASNKIENRLQIQRRYTNTPTEDLIEKISGAIDNVNQLLQSFNQYSSLDQEASMELLDKINNVFSTNNINESDIVSAVLDHRNLTENTPEQVDLD